MKTHYKYIHFAQEDRGRPVWKIQNTKQGLTLAHIEYYPDWKENIFHTTFIDKFPLKVFSKGCLDDISDFMGQLNEGLKA